MDGLVNTFSPKKMHLCLSPGIGCNKICFLNVSNYSKYETSFKYKKISLNMCILMVFNVIIFTLTYYYRYMFIITFLLSKYNTVYNYIYLKEVLKMCFYLFCTLNFKILNI